TWGQLREGLGVLAGSVIRHRRALEETLAVLPPSDLHQLFTTMFQEKVEMWGHFLSDANAHLQILLKQAHQGPFLPPPEMIELS
ncbi:MAG: hypothetical protein Q7S00_02680, partial [bacterium]|nr:hypothetical protein [bacterium]